MELFSCSFISSISLCITSICSFALFSCSSFSEISLRLQLTCELFFVFLQLLYLLLDHF
jgi:hypothetical protein